jgi:DNA polymerase-3 subunit epsilon
MNAIVREIVLDTETTGFSPGDGDRLVEIGCVELINHIPSGKTYHQYVNPQRDMPQGAFEVHGLSEEFLKNYPVFADVAQGFLDFIGDSPLIIHNAPFDVGFLNHELHERLNYAPVDQNRKIIDTLVMAKRRFPGARASLDALCSRFNIDNTKRVKHGALLDSEILAEVYLELIGGREPGFVLAAQTQAHTGETDFVQRPLKRDRPPRPARSYSLTDSEKQAHAAFLEKLKNPIWLQNAD